MSASLNFIGFVRIQEKPYPYHFDGETLLVYITEKLFLNLLWTKASNGTFIHVSRKPFPTSELIGSVLGDFITLHFFFNPISYGYEAKGILNDKCVIKIPIPRYLTESEDIERSKNIIYYESSQFHRFLAMKPNYNVTSINKTTNLLEANVLCNLDEVKHISTFEIEGRKLLLHPSYRASWGGSRFVLMPMLALEIEGVADENFLWRLFFDLDVFVNYAFFRTNIHAESCYFEGDKKKIDFKALWSPAKDEGPEEIDKLDRDSIPWSTIYSHAGGIFKAIDAKEICLDHIGSDKTARRWISVDTVSKDGAAFEKSFMALYPAGFSHSEKRLKAEKEVQEAIEPLKDKATGRAKRIYEGFLKHIRLEALSDKMEYAFTQFASCLKPMKVFVRLTDVEDSDIAQICAGLRNRTDHGEATENIKKKDASCFVLLRALIYALQMKKAGYEESDITIAIRCLYNIR